MTTPITSHLLRLAVLLLIAVPVAVGCKGLPSKASLPSSKGLSSNILKPPAHLTESRSAGAAESAGFASTADRAATHTSNSVSAERDATYTAAYDASYDAAYDAAYHIAYAQQMQQYQLYQQQQYAQQRQQQILQQQAVVVATAPAQPLSPLAVPVQQPATKPAALPVVTPAAPTALPSGSPWDAPTQRQQTAPPANHFSASYTPPPKSTSSIVQVAYTAPETKNSSPANRVIAIPVNPLLSEVVPPTTNASQPLSVVGGDEYIVSGGDRNGAARVHRDWTVSHLEPEDTVAHFDKVGGGVVVVPSNQLAIYAPRFRAVRKVEGVQQDVQRTFVVSNDGRIASATGGKQERLGFVEQEAQSLYARQHDGIDAAQGRNVAGATQGNLSTAGDQNVESVMSYGSLLRRHHLSGEQQSIIARGATHVAAWEGVDGVRVRINQLAALSSSKTEGAAQVFHIEQSEGKSVLRLLQTASTSAASPGDIVEFTVRFDNIGNRPIGNVTLLQSLTTRLEFIPNSAETSLAAGFIVEPNDAGSFTLRWEITDPLLPLEFGVVRFRCRVR